jgi:drug/metabolite transporter (DMT)-like permease
MKHRWCFMIRSGTVVGMTRRDMMLAALVATVWGVNFVVIDWGMADLPPLLFLAARFVLVVLPAILLVPKPDASWRTIVAVGCFMSLGQFGFVYASISAGLPPGLAALVLQAQVVFTIVIAAAALHERPTRNQLAGVVVGAVGLGIVALGRGGDVPSGALALCVVGALSWGIGNVVVRASRVPSGVSLTVWSGLFVPLPLVALSLVLDGPQELADGLASFGWEAAISTLYTAGLASLVGYGIFNTLLSRNPAASVVPWILLVPPVGMASAWIVFADTPALGELLGGVVLIGGVLLAIRPSRGREASRTSELAEASR